jgi:hypothetical protein
VRRSSLWTTLHKGGKDRGSVAGPFNMLVFGERLTPNRSDARANGQHTRSKKAGQEMGLKVRARASSASIVDHSLQVPSHIQGTRLNSRTLFGWNLPILPEILGAKIPGGERINRGPVKWGQPGRGYVRRIERSLAACERYSMPSSPCS